MYFRIAKLDVEGTYHINVKAHFRPNYELRSTYVSPQLEANHRIPVRRLCAVSVGVEPPPFVNCGASLLMLNLIRSDFSRYKHFFLLELNIALEFCTHERI